MSWGDGVYNWVDRGKEGMERVDGSPPPLYKNISLRWRKGYSSILSYAFMAIRLVSLGNLITASKPFLIGDGKGDWTPSQQNICW